MDGNISLFVGLPSHVDGLPIAAVGAAAPCCGVTATVSVDGIVKLSYWGGLATVAVGAAAPCCGIMATASLAVIRYTANNNKQHVTIRIMTLILITIMTPIPITMVINVLMIIIIK